MSDTSEHIYQHLFLSLSLSLSLLQISILSVFLIFTQLKQNFPLGRKQGMCYSVKASKHVQSSKSMNLCNNNIFSIQKWTSNKNMDTEDTDTYFSG